MPGHLFIIDGDLTHLAVDACLLPTDDRFHITSSFSAAFNKTGDFTLKLPPWNPGERVRPYTSERLGTTPWLWIGDIGRDWETYRSFYSIEQKQRWIQDIVRQFASLATAQVKALGPRLRLAVNALGTGEGGFQSDKGTVYESLIPALYERRFYRI